jgi:signal transduction histidine kinase
MQAMINDVLDFARGRISNGIPVAPEETDMSVIVSEAVDEASAAANGAFDFEASGDLRGVWDAERVRQALSNLLRNARQHGHGKIVVRAYESEDHTHVLTSVCNQGRPISQHLLSHIFEPYVREQSDLKSGLGLGLFIVRQVAQAHGAVCRVTSSAERGTEFLIDWPRVSQPASAMSSSMMSKP